MARTSNCLTSESQCLRPPFQSATQLLRHGHVCLRQPLLFLFTKHASAAWTTQMSRNHTLIVTVPASASSRPARPLHHSRRPTSLFPVLHPNSSCSAASRIFHTSSDPHSRNVVAFPADSACLLPISESCHVVPKIECIPIPKDSLPVLRRDVQEVMCVGLKS